MRNKTILISVLVLLLGLTSWFVACGGGSSSGDDDSSSDDDVSQGQPGTIQAFVHDFQTKQPVQDAVVEVLNDETGESLSDPAITTTSPENGSVTLTIPSGVKTIGIKVTKGNAIDTVQFHFDVGVKGEEFLLLSKATQDLIAMSLGITIDPAKATVGGGVYWGDPASESSIGCSEVTFDPDDGAHVYYFGNDALPTPARDITATTPDTGQGTNPGYDGKGHSISYFAGVNKDVTTNVTLTATIYSAAGNGTAADSVTASDTIPRLYANTLSIANAYFGKSKYPANPTPAWCLN